MADIIAAKSEEAPYCCDVPNCDKRFKRSDHLLRHKRNHENAVLFTCTWPDCGKTFVRKDVRLKHVKRHVIKAEKERSKSTPQIKFYEMYTPDSIDSGRPLRENDSLFEPLKVLSQPGSPLEDNLQFSATPKSSIEYVMNSEPKFMDEFDSSINFGNDMAMDNLIDFLLNDEGQDISNKYLDYSPSSSFKDLLGSTPDLVYSTTQSTLSEATIKKLAEVIPTLKDDPYFTAEYIEKYLDLYWCIYHIQFPIIHRTTFSTKKANPLLLLSMIAMGASLNSRRLHERDDRAGMIKLAENIAQPLRWLIYSQSEYFSTINSWIIQSLLILECFEVTCSNRRLHRRAHLHHGFKIELLRRSPLLGGDPSKASSIDHLPTVWEDWVELESLKRCAYVAFLVDIYNAIIFGHDSILFAHHIKLSLPCAEEVWENVKESKNIEFDNEKFLTTIKKILRRQEVETSPLVSKLLLVGLISLVFQTEQNDIQTRTLQGQNMKSWKNDLLSALDYWYDSVIDETCCQLENAYYCPTDILTLSLSKPDDTTCKFAVYHICQSFLRITQYDCIIYAGAPNRMNVKAEQMDFELVERRYERWVHSSTGRQSVTHAFVLLCEIFLSQDDLGKYIPVTYDPNSDPIFYRPNIVASAMLLVWGYTYCIYGPESNYLETASSEQLSSNWVPEKINGYQYLQKIKKRFCEVDNGINSSQKFGIYADNLQSITNKHHTVGLLRLVKDKYKECNSQICREYGKLLENCIQRSLGKKQPTCNDMYDDVY